MVTLSELAPPKNHHACAEPQPPALGRVLVCLDRSASSDVSLPYAQLLAEAFGASVTLLHVMPSPPTSHEANRADALEWELSKREADVYLGRAEASLHLPTGRTERRLCQGAPADQIACIGREVAADLTILSSHGEGATVDLGSIAQHVLGTSSGSILLVPTAPTRVPPHRIMVPLDGAVRSECVLPIVVDLARRHGAEILLVHVVPDPIATSVLSDAEDMRLATSLASRLERNADLYLSRVRARLLPQASSVQTLVLRRSDERQALLDVARDRSVDMLFLTAHGSQCNVDRPFGSVTSYLLAHGQLPLFVFQDCPQPLAETSPQPSQRTGTTVRPPVGD